AIGVGFGAQNIINNLISGWILMSERPVRIGDFVEIDDHRGTVESIGNRSTRIRRIDGVHLLVPNSQMLERVVVNWTLIDRDFRTTVRVGVAYGSPVRRVEELLYQAAGAQEDVLDTPKPIVVFEDFGDNSLVFDLFFWCHAGGERELRVIRSDIRFRIEQLFAENGITIAFPQRDVHLFAKSPIEFRRVEE
ncbi:MAG: mechanosensitive ion channel domain-containing protein, partial [Xanthomonadales bacterium]|nr:mechanosensitive ion channel domain-containing protein [Xanthomonadales bacterium]